MMRHTEQAEIDALHPSLPGHFRGDPIVPGVLILARVLKAAGIAFGARPSSVPVAKFHARLRPAEPFTIELERSADGDVRFRVQRHEVLIASGIVRLRASK